MSGDQIDQIIDKYVNEKGILIQLLLDIQHEFRWIPNDAIKRISERLKIPYSQIFRVASFYAALSLKPIGRHLVQVCLGTACHVRGSNSVLEELERELGIKNGETTEDMNFTLESVNCLGACALGPIATVNEDYHGQLNGSKVNKMLKKYQSDTGAN